MENKKIKVVVTGGAGFIGSQLVDELIDRGFDVHIIDNLSNGNIEHVNKEARFFKEDIRDIEAVRKIMDGTSYVFHTAALPRVQYSIENPIETHDVNVNGTLNLLVAAKDTGVKKFIYSASSSAYGDQSVMPLHEEMASNPLSPYGLQKYIGELKCRVFSKVYGLPTVSLRYFNVYGPRFKAGGAYALVIGKFLKQKKEGMPLTIVPTGEQTRDFTHVRDVVAANILAMESDKAVHGEVFNVGAGRNFSINQVAELIGGPVEFCESRLEPQHTLADNSKARNILGWEPKISLEEGIAELKKLYLGE